MQPRFSMLTVVGPAPHKKRHHLCSTSTQRRLKRRMQCFSPCNLLGASTPEKLVDVQQHIQVMACALGI